MNSKELCLATILGKEHGRTPVFPLLMSFSAKLAGITYKQFASDGNAMAEAQIKARETFGIDAITACSDAFRICADLGGEIVFPIDSPPHLEKPLVANESDFKSLIKPDVLKPGGRMADRVKGTSVMSKIVGNDCLVLGWVDMPFAEACSLCGVSEFMMMLYDEPALAHNILEFLSDIVIDFSLAQLEAGAPMIGAGDAAASLISPDLYREFALPYEQRVCEAIHNAKGLVKLHICGNTTNLLNDMVLSGADLFNVDHLVDISYASSIYTNTNKAFKGNLNPVSDLLHSSPDVCQTKAIECIKKANSNKYYLSAGCEVPQDVTYEVFKAFCDAPKYI